MYKEIFIIYQNIYDMSNNQGSHMVHVKKKHKHTIKSLSEAQLKPPR